MSSGLSGISGLNSLLAYGTSASFAARRVSYMTKLSGIGSTQETNRASQTKASDASKQTRQTASTISGNLNQRLAGYKKDVTAVESAAAELSASNSKSAFAYIEYGSADEAVATVKAKAGGLSSEKQFHVQVDQLADAKTGAKAMYSITTGQDTVSFTSDSNEVTLFDGSGSMTLKSVGATDVYSGTDTDRVADAMQKLVDGYNKAVEQGRQNRTGSYLTTPSIAERDMKKAGLSVNRNGELSFDRDALTKSLAEDFDGTKQLIGGNYGVANMLRQSTVNKINDAINRTVEDAYAGSQAAFGRAGVSAGDSIETIISDREAMRSTFGAMFQFSKSSPYSMSNYYAVGNMLNTLA